MMATDAALELADSLVYRATGRHLNDLQKAILQQVWQGRKYPDIAHHAGYTEGHIKDVASHLWRLLSKALGEKVTKATLKSALERHLKRWSGSASADPALTASLFANPTAAGGLGFVGREDAIATLTQLIQQGHRAIVIQGEGGLGKTTLAQRFLETCPSYRRLELLMAKETADIVPVERVAEEWLKQDFGVEPGREFGVTLDRLRRQLQQHRVAILIDNLEPALDAEGRWVAAHRRYQELLRVLTDARSQTITLITSRDRVCEPGVRLYHYRLPGLDQAAWGEYCRQRSLRVDPTCLAQMHAAYGGNAKAMDILCGVIQADFGGDLATYWQTQGQDLLSPLDLKHLVDSQVNRLQAHDADAYRVFCRLGVYRYQAVPRVPAAAIFCLMDDLPPEQHRTILATLCNRSLVESAQGQYWLHPVVRATALTRLRTQADWVTAHRQAADFWTHHIQRITNLSEALQALEAYYHLIAIEDYGAAGRVILHSRDNQWQQFLPLGSTLYRMGLIQPVMTAIATLIDRIPDDSDASELYNILGDLYWISGQISAAIDCQQRAMAIAQQCLAQTSPDDPHRRYYLTMLAVDSRLSLGLYHLDRWELDTAADCFQQVIDQASDTAHHRWAEKARVCLARVLAAQGQRMAAKTLADAMYHTVLQGEQTERYAFFQQLLGQTYSTLGAVDAAQTLLTAALAAAETGHYIQIKANALSGLGTLARLGGDWAGAIAHHQQAIALLEDLGAQCDLAEAHFHLGLTYQAMGSRLHGQAFAQAMRLFGEIEAPEQVARVRRVGG